MLQFIAGCFVGVFMYMFVMGLIIAGDEDDRKDMCKDCPYDGYASGVNDCLKCHYAEDDGDD